MFHKCFLSYLQWITFPVFVLFFGLRPFTSSSLTAVVLFVVVCYASSIAYQSILWDLNILKNQPMDKEHYDHLSSLKRHHMLVCETIDHINDCFGWILGISLLFHFVSIITTSFYLFGNERKPTTLLEQSFFISQILHTLLICYAPDMIHGKVCKGDRKSIRMLN